MVRRHAGPAVVRLVPRAARPRPHRRHPQQLGPGAREAERHHGFEAVTDDIVYSHEVGLAKPDPAIYELTAGRLGVRPEEITFLDDAPANVEAALAAGWHAVLHEDTAASIAAVEALIGGSAGEVQVS